MRIQSYVFSSASCQWQSITNIEIGFGHLMISDSQFFVLGVSPSAPYDLHMYKLTFSKTSVDWADKIACASGTWTSSFSESVLSADGLSIYSFINFGSSRYLYFVSLSVSTGSVIGTRYKSSVTTNYVWGSALNGDYLIRLKLRDILYSDTLIKYCYAQLNLLIKIKYILFFFYLKFKNSYFVKRINKKIQNVKI